MKDQITEQIDNILEAQDETNVQLRSMLADAETIRASQADTIERLSIQGAEMEVMLVSAISLMQRSKRIISNQMPGTPHLIETELETLSIKIEDELERIHK